jgi:hypothetical protein
MDAHPEKLMVDGQLQTTNGIKVKMHFNDDSERYAWCIIDKFGDAQIFERNISWSFTNFTRETQMWLHDRWLQHHSNMLNAIF